MRKWCEFIVRDWRRRRVIMRHIENHYAIAKKYGRGECKDATRSEPETMIWNCICNREMLDIWKEEEFSASRSPLER